MYVLTGIFGNGEYAKIWDSKDGVSENVNFITIAKEITEKGLKVYGIRPYKPDEVYPPDKRVVKEMGIVIIPSEAQTALANAPTLDPPNS